MSHNRTPGQMVGRRGSIRTNGNVTCHSRYFVWSLGAHRKSKSFYRGVTDRVPPLLTYSSHASKVPSQGADGSALLSSTPCLDPGHTSVDTHDPWVGCERRGWGSVTETRLDRWHEGLRPPCHHSRLLVHINFLKFLSRFSGTGGSR